ncbi:cyclic nucleotide-gated channel rod photoreceptor subunit alpha isoform X2 [Euwallacea fornicatus]|uniref:cyclic nucleotide-gated channel rod photoreceptor subunit alpha isoform X2 n=1 Tax=Euwallacea fornicatus TaxID=995702 RepID=UPI00338D3F21
MSTARRLVLSLRGRKQSQDSSAGRLVGGPGCKGAAGGGCHELDEIAVVSSSADPLHLKYGGEIAGAQPISCNGPRLVPGIITSGGGCMVGERLRGSGGGLELALNPPARPSTHKSSTESVNRVLKSVSKQSLLNLVGCKLGMSKCGPSERSSFQQEGFFSSSRDSLPAAYVNRAANVSSASELDLSRKHRRKDLRSKLKLPTSVTLASSGEGPLLGAWRTAPGSTAGTNPPSINHLSTSSCNGTESRYGFRRVDSYPGRLRAGSTGWSFVFDPAGRLSYYWSMIVSLACLYNLWVIIYRFAFREIDSSTILVWFCLDYFADFLYLMDILVHFRTGYLEDGVLQTDAVKLRQHYMNSTTFYIDCLCLLPLDFLYLSIGFNSILRLSRLIKLYRFWAFMDRTERHTNYPNFVRSSYLIHTLLVVFHWNGCVFHLVLKNDGFGSKNWVYSDSASNTDHVKAYLQSYYWCTLALTTIGDLPRPRSKPEYLFVIFQLLFGLLLFASVMGHVANIVTSVSAARKEFQAKLDGVKTYMRMRRVPTHLQVKVIKWFDYLWLTQKCSDEERAVSCLPDKLKAEIAINVHLDTLKRVEIFQNTEAGFLCELVLRLRPVLFSPGDYICRKGEVGKEMYIVNRGRLQVVADNGRNVLATLKAGSYFGEISILNMGTAGKWLGNRRTASVRSVGYSDLFVLSKKDMWDVLKEYPAARVRLEAIAVKRLEKYKRAPLEKAAMGRSQSTPGLVESRGKVALEDMWIPPVPLGALTSFYPRSSMGASSPQQSIRTMPTPDSPAGSTSSERSRQSRHGRHQHARSGTTINGGESMTQLVSGRTTPLIASHEILEQEIKRLRERLQTVESENAAMSVKLSQQQWELEHRLAEIEMQICGSPSTSSLDQDELDQNRESII